MSSFTVLWFYQAEVHLMILFVVNHVMYYTASILKPFEPHIVPSFTTEIKFSFCLVKMLPTLFVLFEFIGEE